MINQISNIKKILKEVTNILKSNYESAIIIKKNILENQKNYNLKIPFIKRFWTNFSMTLYGPHFQTTANDYFNLKIYKHDLNLFHNSSTLNTIKKQLIKAEEISLLYYKLYNYLEKLSEEDKKILNSALQSLYESDEMK